MTAFYIAACQFTWRKLRAGNIPDKKESFLGQYLQSCFLIIHAWGIVIVCLAQVGHDALEHDGLENTLQALGKRIFPYSLFIFMEAVYGANRACANPLPGLKHDTPFRSDNHIIGMAWHCNVKARKWTEVEELIESPYERSTKNRIELPCWHHVSFDLSISLSNAALSEIWA